MTPSERLEVKPNPFNGSVVLRFSVPIEGRYSMIIYNALGQRVKTMFDTWVGAGAYEIHWNGKDDASSLLGSGIYLVQIKSKESAFNLTAKLMHVQ